MTQTVNVYTQGKVLLGQGTATSGSATIASFTRTSGNGGSYSSVGNGRNVLVSSTTGANATGRSYMTRCVTDGVTSLTLADKHPFAD